MNTFDYLVYIGRFQPFHVAHLEVVKIALQQSQHVILALGSAQPVRNIKNPLLVQEREAMILSNFDVQEQKRIHFVHLVDVYDDEKWTALLKAQVATVAPAQAKVGLIGHFKDESSYYLNLFPEWPLMEIENLKNAISATPLREQYYQGVLPGLNALPAGTHQYLQEFQKTAWYAQLKEKYARHDATDL